MSRAARIVFLLATPLLALSGADAQRPDAAGVQNEARGDGPRAHEFWPVAPEVGDLFPDVTVADDEGNLVSIRELTAENYSVLVLGCLT